MTKPYAMDIHLASQVFSRSRRLSQKHLVVLGKKGTHPICYTIEVH